jgi:demethylmenaquinone methyltransferase/2-methoxy-6-polyprenyl-1,4-benzoquinol methylase
MNRFNLYAKIYDSFMKWSGFDNQTALVIKYLQPNKNQIILDIAGGTGYLASKIASKTKQVVVLDSSKQMLNQAKKKQADFKNIKIKLAKAEKLPFDDNYFDSVVLIDALHHIKKVDRAIKEAKRVLKNNGKIIIFEFEIKGLKGWLFWLFEKIYVDNSKFIKPAQLLKKMQLHNFSGKIISVSKLKYLYVGKKR